MSVVKERKPELTFQTYVRLISIAEGMRKKDKTLEKVFTLTLPTCFILELMQQFPELRCTRLCEAQIIEGFSRFFFYPAGAQV